MQDSELKKLLQETCPIRPGQESRAWSDLREQLYGEKSARSAWSWLPTWRVSALALSGLVAIFVVGEVAWQDHSTPTLPLVASAAPNIYATSFYSSSAQAQVVWLNGLEPATDKPTAPRPTTPPDAPRNSL